jgi:hypothetical protein
MVTVAPSPLKTPDFSLKTLGTIPALRVCIGVARTETPREHQEDKSENRRTSNGNDVWTCGTDDYDDD